MNKSYLDIYEVIKNFILNNEFEKYGDKRLNKIFQCIINPNYAIITSNYNMGLYTIRIDTDTIEPRKCIILDFKFDDYKIFDINETTELVLKSNNLKDVFEFFYINDEKVEQSLYECI